MNPAYQQFSDLKKEQKSDFIKQRSELTLYWYEKIGELLNDPVYENHYEFLSSVEEFITTNEYLTDKQIEAIENIMVSPIW